MSFWAIFLPLWLAAMPATSNYALQSFGFGSGGGVGNTVNYSLNGLTGEVSGADAGTANYGAKPGLVNTTQANLPGAPAVDNGGGAYYNKLHFVVDPQNNPTDALFVVAVSSDGFATTNFVQADGTVAATPLYQTYAAWGGSTGMFAVGLANGTSYQFKVKATAGRFSETGFGPANAAVATVSPTLSFSLSPSSVSFNSLLPGTVTASQQNITSTLDTNAYSGGFIYLKGQNGGLTSTAASYTIASGSADLASVLEGYGAQTVSASGLTAQAPYDGTGGNVGLTNTIIRTLYQAAGPVAGGQGVTVLKAKSSASTPAASDYADILTFLAAAAF